MMGPRLDVKGGVSRVSNLMIDGNNTDYEIIFRPTMNDKSLLGRLTHFFARIALFPYERLVIRPDIVHIHFSHSLSTWRKLLISTIWRNSGTPVILHAHSSDYRDYLPSLPWPLSYLAKRMVRKSDSLVVLSESWASFYSESCNMGRESIHVMENPIVKTEIVSRKDNLILFSGRIGDRKGAFRLLEAWSEIDESIREGWKLILTGDGKISQAKSLVGQMSISESTSILGWIGDDELEDLMKKSSIFVLPSINEGLPMSLLNAMSSETAVITSPVGGIPEIVENRRNGILIDPMSIDILSKTISELILDSELRENLARKALESTEALDITTYMPKMKEIWDSVTSKNRL